MSDVGPNIFEELDALPDPGRPALTFCTAAMVAEESARAALDAVADGKHGRARFALEAVCGDMRPTFDHGTMDAWTRAGAVTGIIAAWECTTKSLPVYIAPEDCPSTTHAALHLAAWSLTATVVTGVRYE